MSIDKAQRDAWAKPAEPKSTSCDDTDCAYRECMLSAAVAALLAELARMEQERDYWLDKFNKSEQFQQGPLKRAEAAEATAAKWQRAVEGFQAYLDEGDKLHEVLDRLRASEGL